MKTKSIARKLTILFLLVISVQAFSQGGPGGLGGPGGMGGPGGLGGPGGMGGPGGGMGLPGGLGGLGGLGGGTVTDTAIIIDSVIQTSLCSGVTIIVMYHTTSTFTFGNVFTAQLVSGLGGLGGLLGLGGTTTPINLIPASGNFGGLLSGMGGGESKTLIGTAPKNTPTGIYNVRMTSSKPVHTSATSSTNVIISNPTVSISSACRNDSIFLTATTGGTSAVLSALAGLLLPGGASTTPPLLWSTGATDSTIYVENAGRYSVTFTDTTLGCNATGNVSVIKDPIKIDCQKENVVLSSPVNADSYAWSVDSKLKSTSKSVTLKNDATIEYHLFTSNPVNCVSINVTPSICTDSNDLYIFVPTIFTPNGDGHNDKLYVRGNNIKELYFSIYDRWGELVFNTDDQKNGWDGTYKGKELDPTVLVWYVKTKNYLGEEKEDKGYVTLMR